MTVEVILLALATAIRPTSLAAVYALLSGNAPRRLMTAYVVAGIAFTTTIGLLVIWAFTGVDINSGTSRTKGIAQLAGGVLMLALGVLVARRRIGARHADRAPKPSGRWSALLEQHLTVRTAAVAGPATHLPGLFYLVALNLIVANEPNVPRSLFELFTYNAIWFLIPIAALAICIVEPATALEVVENVQDWIRAHTRAIVLVICFAVGSGLVVRGLVTV
jgi:Sap, sulfolipid-1-addressing protein